ncbi:hypothetical protein [Streptomyces griseochromogenes]|uniref:hypothetical protein n=1 Tax=Streptomyces griseochromogenes TaxID=68214 RepID=UPI0037B22700
MTVLLFLLSAGLMAMACVKADRVRSWRESLNPSAPDIADSSFTVARTALLAMAAFGIYYGFQSLAVADEAKWSGGELTRAVLGAADALDGTSTYAGPNDDEPADFDGEYRLKIEDEVTAHGGGDAPDFGADVTLGSPEKPNEAHYTVTADGTPSAFCMHVVLNRDKADDYEAPGIAGQTYPQHKYVFSVTSRAGQC